MPQEAPPGPRSSPELEALKARREELRKKLLDFDAADEYIDFNRTHQILDGAIGDIQGTKGSWVDYVARAEHGAAAGASDGVYVEAANPTQLYRLGEPASPLERTFDHALSPQLYIEDVAEHYGINLRGSGQKISVLYDETLAVGKYGVTYAAEGGRSYELVQRL